MRFYDESMGAGRPVVFLPGAGWPGRQGLIIGELMAKTRLFAMLDLPGYGRSQGTVASASDRAVADWLVSYLDAQGWPSAHVVGHSLGGYVALTLAYYYPERTDSLTLLDVGPMKVPRWHSQPGIFGYVVPFLSLAERIVGVAGLARMLNGLDSGNAQEPLEIRMQQYVDKGVYRLSDHRYLALALDYEPQLDVGGLTLLFAMYRSDLPRLLQRVRVPTLLVYATRPSGSPSIQERIQKAVGRALARNPNLESLAVNGGHYVHWMESGVAQAIVRHIDKLDSGPSH